MAKVIIVTSICAFGLSYLAYQAVKELDIYKELTVHSDQNCIRVPLHSAPEDFVLFKDFIISGVDDRDTLWGTEAGAVLADDGNLIAIDPVSNTYFNITLANFPAHTAFHPHGLYLYDENNLYVINHAYRRGGERVDIFQLTLQDSQVVAQYLRSISFPDTFLGALNNLVVLNKKEMYVTTWLPWPDNPDGRGIGVLESILRVLFYKLTKKTHVFYCVIENNTPNCRSVDSGYLMNGIEMVNQKIFAVDSAAKKIKIYSIGPEKQLIQEKEIDVKCGIDNLHYDAKENALYSGGVTRTIDLIIHIDASSSGKHTMIPSSIIKIDLNDYSVKEVIITDKYSGASSAIPLGDKLVLGSWTDFGVFICPK